MANVVVIILIVIGSVLALGAGLVLAGYVFTRLRKKRPPTFPTIALIAIGGLLVLGLCLAASGFIVSTFAIINPAATETRFIETDATAVAAAGEEIADYTLPPGFGDGYTATLAGFSLVSYTGGDGRTHIYLMQAPSTLELDREQLENRMRETAGTDEWTDLTVVERRSRQIRGEETTLVISEGVNQDGRRYRSAAAFFTGEGGPALVNVSGPAATWDQDTVNAFLDSLR